MERDYVLETLRRNLGRLERAKERCEKALAITVQGEKRTSLENDLRIINDEINHTNVFIEMRKEGRSK